MSQPPPPASTTDCRSPIVSATLVLADVTDICVVFARCDDLLAQCAKQQQSISSPILSRVQSIYGAFRHSFIRWGVDGSDGGTPDEWDQDGKRRVRRKKKERSDAAKTTDTQAVKSLEVHLAEVVPWAMLAREPNCGRHIDLIIRRRAQRPLLGELGELLTHAPSGVCVRVAVYETHGNRTRGMQRLFGGRLWSKASRRRGALAPASTPVLSLPSADVRDALFGVQRLIAVATPSDRDDLDALLSAHRAYARDATGGAGRPTSEADTTILLSDSAGLGDFLTTQRGLHHVDPFCRARALLTHEYGPAAMRLAGGAVALRLSTADALRGGSAASWMTKAARWETSSARKPPVAGAPPAAGAPLGVEDVAPQLLPSYSCRVLKQAERTRVAQVRQRLIRALAMLTAHVAHVMTDDKGAGMAGMASIAGIAGIAAGRAGGSTGAVNGLLGGASGGGRAPRRLSNLSSIAGWTGALGRIRPPWRAVPLACLEEDFIDSNRELTPAGAAGAYAACPQSVVDGSARLAAALHSEVRLVQSGEHPEQRSERQRSERQRSEQRQRRETDGKQCQLGANRRRAADSLVAVSLHPSGFFSLLHGLLKPLMYTLRTRRVLLTPRVLEFTHEDSKLSPCPERDLSCFFEPLAPACDALERQVGERRAARALNSSRERPKGFPPKGQPTGGRKWPALPRALQKSRSEVFVMDEARASRHIPAAYRERGWFWYASQLLSYLLRPNPALSRALEGALEATRLRKALDGGSLIVGMHVRHGDACRGDEIVRARRSCTPLSTYMDRASRLLAKRAGRGSGGAGGAGGSKPVVYLATDSNSVIKESADYADRFDIVHLPNEVVGRHNPKQGEALLWDRRIWQRYYWGQTEWTQFMAWGATVEMLLLAHADIFVGKFTSNMFRAAYALRAAQCDCAPIFASLDAPYCFDYGLRSGRNFEFPLANASLGVRDRADATFQC